ncbi:hypothetical protein IR073_06500 [Gemella sp. 19428wG2_WT2a]|nr:hypothetical protein [Gemella sp. 19428wG2_WT2a]TFU57686.1 hypothetical protein E4T67_06425 [Gemella sp. WT2a]
MALYRTTTSLRDYSDDEYLYKENAVFPRKGLTVSEERIKDLLNKDLIKVEKKEVKKSKKGE